MRLLWNNIYCPGLQAGEKEYEFLAPAIIPGTKDKRYFSARNKRYFQPPRPEGLGKRVQITDNTMQNPWDERYAVQEYIYGTDPNSFLKEILTSLKPGRILFPAEGEGRNAVFAARQGWETHAFDQSNEGRKKALKLASQNDVFINYTIQPLDDWNPEPEQYDCLALIFVHLPEDLRQRVHQSAIRALKTGGILILEAFTINQLTRSSGGPRTAELLYTFDQLKSDFSMLSGVKISETQVQLNEGLFHQGLADVIRLTGYKPAV